MATIDAKTQLEELLTKLGFEASVSSEVEADRTILTVDSPDHALLIGKKGETLRALQHIFNTILKQASEDFVTIDVAGYRKAREERLEAIANEAAERARLTKHKVHLKPMNAYERRQVHMVLADMPDIVTTSEGVEPYRVIVVQLRG